MNVPVHAVYATANTMTERSYIYYIHIYMYIYIYIEGGTLLHVCVAL